jgi:acyl-homoserine lactone acylase PvdQ
VLTSKNFCNIITRFESTDEKINIRLTRHGVIIDFKDMANSKRILPGDISGNVMSPHYDDQLTLWRNGDYRPFVLDREAVVEDARYRMVISPAR